MTKSEESAVKERYTEPGKKILLAICHVSETSDVFFVRPSLITCRLCSRQGQKDDS